MTGQKGHPPLTSDGTDFSLLFILGKWQTMIERKDHVTKGTLMSGCTLLDVRVYWGWWEEAAASGWAPSRPLS